MLVLILAAGRAGAQAVPELMYYKFDAGTTTTVNSASAPVGTNPSPMTNITIGGTGQFGAALQGTGVTTTSSVNNGWATNLVSTPWTISFWVNNLPSSTTLWYLWGDGGNSMRCFVNGAPGQGNMRLTGTGLPTVDIVGVTGAPYVIHFVRTVTPNEIKAYKNGVLYSTTAITGTLTVGTGFTIGQYTTSSNLNGQLDEFRMYNRALSATEITDTWNQTLPLGGPCSGTPSVPTITTAALTTPICNTTQTITATYPTISSGGINYQWEQGSSATGPWSSVTGGTGATTLSYTTPALTTATWYRLKATCTNSSASNYSAAFAVPVAQPQPGAITGRNTFCPGNNQVYSVPTASLPTTYTWTLPATWTGTSTTNSISAVTNGTAGGTISVTATGACGTSTAQTLAVTPGTPPAQPAAISGNTIVCNGATQPFSIGAVTDANSYIWTLPTGWTGTSTGTSINVTPGTAGGTIRVAAVNNCGSSAQQTLAVNVTTQPLTVGSIIGDSIVCPGVAKLYRVIRVPNALSYTWTTPSGYLGVSNTDTLNVIYIPASGTITVTANNGCAGAVPSGKVITVLPVLTPSVSASTPNLSVCSGIPVNFLATPLNGGASPTYQWMRNGVAVSGATGNTFSSSSLAHNDQITVVMTSNYLCTTSAAAGSNALRMNVTQSVSPGVNVNSNALGTTCSGVPVTFTANIFAGGTAPVYQWMRNQSPVGSNSPVYTLPTPSNADSIYCILTSNAACATSATATSNKVGLTVAPSVVPNVTVSVSPGTTIFNGQTVTFTASPVNGGTIPAYQWLRNGIEVSGATSAAYTTNTLRNGDQVSVRMISSNICAAPTMATSNRVTISVPSTAVGQLNGSDGRITLAPNPNKGRFLVNAEWDARMSNQQVTIEVLNTVGQVVYSSQTRVNSGTWQQEISLQDAAPGLYLLRLKADDIQYVRKFEVAR